MVKATESSPVEEVVYDNPFENYYTTGDGIVSVVLFTDIFRVLEF